MPDAADPLEERAVQLVAEALTAIWKRPGEPVTEGMRFRARQVVGHLAKADLLKTSTDASAITLDRAKAIEIRNQLTYMQDRLGTAPGAVLALSDHLTDLITRR